MLRVSGLGKEFPVFNSPTGERQQVLKDLNFAVDRGEFVALLGPSGCGKTTFLRIATKLETPDAGEIRVDGRADYRPGRDLCLVFQNYGLLPWLTVQQNVELGLKLQSQPPAARQPAAQRVLELVGLAGYDRYYPHQLSGGMQQRVGLARALACEPPVLLMDEPFASLDAQMRETLQDELLRIWGQTGNTVLFVTHSIDEAVYLADRVVILRASPGRVHRTVSVDLPRPRWQHPIRTLPEFHTLCAEIRAVLGEGTPAAAAAGGA